jgi:sugar phosphate permease
MQWPVPTQYAAMTLVFVAVIRVHALVHAAIYLSQMRPVRQHPPTQRYLLYAVRAHCGTLMHGACKDGAALVFLMGGITTSG